MKKEELRDLVINAGMIFNVVFVFTKKRTESITRERILLDQPATVSFSKTPTF